MPHCARCGTNVHPFSFRSFSKVTGRCNKCDSEIERAVIRFIDKFREFAADGVLTREEWKQLEALAQNENLDLNEALHYASPDVTELIRKGVEIAVKDEVITPHEERYFDFLFSILSVPESLADEVRATIAEYKAGQEIRKGILPSIQTSFPMLSGEICHLETAADYVNTDTKTYPRRSGRLWLTSMKLIFVSAQRDFDLDWKRVKSIVREGDVLVLEASIKKGNGLYIVERPIIVEAMITRLIALSRMSDSTKVPPKEKQKKQSRADSGPAHTANQYNSKTAYDV
jgi:hypothetical protein